MFVRKTLLSPQIAMKTSCMSSCGLTRILFFATLFFASISQAQVGIGNTNPDSSAMLDIASTSKGLLAPRMTTEQRLAITAPANGLMVYDTTLKSFYFYDGSTTAWVKFSSSLEKRINFVLVKSLADFPAPASGVITLDENTFYEINGVISLAGNTIDLNNAYLSGLDTNEDVIVAGVGTTVFTGTTGGSIRNITITGGGTVFNISGSAAQNMIFQNAIIANMSSVGTIAGLGLYFSTVVQFAGNAGGITYNNIGTLLLSNQAWLEGNGGTYETFTGTFNIVGKVSGFSTVGTGATGINVSSNPTVGVGTLFSTLFSGAGTYVNKYTTGSYPGFSFTNSWTVNCPGIPRESDNEASENIYYNGTITTGFVQTVTNGSEFNLSGTSPNFNTTTAVNIFRFSSPQNNRLTYLGKGTRTFLVNASLSVRGNSGTGDHYAFFIKKNGATSLIETNTLMRVNTTTDISSNSISGTVELAPNDYIEIWGQRVTGSGTTSITVFSLNVNVK